jgi:hypothetical protein
MDMVGTNDTNVFQMGKETIMKKHIILLLVIGVLGFLGCRPNLVIQTRPVIDFSAKTIEVEVANIGKESAGSHLTYIEINDVDAADADKPQTQYRANISGIDAGDSWNSGAIPFSRFSSTRGLDLNSLTAANVVVRADAKNMVEESNETDNVYDADH